MADADPFLFVSHVSEDRAAALEIVDELERRGVPCWIAPRNVTPGHPFDDEIAAALDHCRAMLLIFSEQCNESEYIRREVTVAGENHKIIIPLRIEDVQPRRVFASGFPICIGSTASPDANPRSTSWPGGSAQPGRTWGSSRNPRPSSSRRARRRPRFLVLAGRARRPPRLPRRQPQRASRNPRP